MTTCPIPARERRALGDHHTEILRRCAAVGPPGIRSSTRSTDSTVDAHHWPALQRRRLVTVALTEAGKFVVITELGRAYLAWLDREAA